jgi:hypothetical protein
MRTRRGDGRPYRKTQWQNSDWESVGDRTWVLRCKGEEAMWHEKVT